jgi:hypothetical protein
MDPLAVSAQFAAYVYYRGCRTNADRSDAEAMQFARENWVTFLPLAHDGLGRLLLDIAKVPGDAPNDVLAELPFSLN